MRENAGDKQNVEQMGTTSTNESASRIQRQTNCSNMSPLTLEIRRDRQTDRRTDGRQTVTLRLPLNAVSVVSRIITLVR